MMALDDQKFVTLLLLQQRMKLAEASLVDLAKGLGPAGPGQVCLGCEGCEAQQVAHNRQAERPWDLGVALHILCTRGIIVKT